MKQGLRLITLFFCWLVFIFTAEAGYESDEREQVQFIPSNKSVKTYDSYEVTIQVKNLKAENPFTDVVIEGKFQLKGGLSKDVDGFCDAQDGSVFRIRFMPQQAGSYTYEIRYKHGNLEKQYQGEFEGVVSGRKGLLRVDTDYPFHFIWEGTGEHYFWNGTTAYWLMGWQDEAVIYESIDRLARLKVNRIRACLSGRVRSGRDWFENVYQTDKFKFRLNPWIAQNPDSLEPSFDVARFSVAYWQKFERMLVHARERDVIISVIFYIDANKPGNDPFGKEKAGGSDEQRYYRYAVARFGAFSNVTWDLSNEYRYIRTDDQINRMGALVKQWDPYDHLASVHGFHDFHFRTSPWADFAMYQMWDECGEYGYMLMNRQLQIYSGRIIPQINEEYGYEDHYPPWGCGVRVAPGRSADNRRRLAFNVAMAGGYQTTGERADRGTGWGPDSGGGWINGRGDSTMTMLEGFANIVDIFTSLAWWKMEPHDELVNLWYHCLAEPGHQYLVYMSYPGKAILQLEPGTYRAEWANPRNGERIPIGRVEGQEWTSPQTPDDEGDWALILISIEK